MDATRNNLLEMERAASMLYCFLLISLQYPSFNLYLRKRGEAIMEKEKTVKNIEIEFKIEYDKELTRKIKKWRNRVPVMCATWLLSFILSCIFFLTEKPMLFLIFLSVFAIALFVHLLIIGKIYDFEKELDMDIFSGDSGYPC